MPRISGFHQDDDGHWVAELDCGHSQHVRHKPPLQSRPWVVTEDGRRDKLGETLPCKLCGMPRLPDTVKEYKRTREFDHATVPKGLTRSHRTKAGVWGEIVVTRGHLVYVIERTPHASFPLNPRTPGIVSPAQPHHVIVPEGGAFYVRFLR